MTFKRAMKLSFCAGAIVVLAACASTPEPKETVVYEAPKTQQEKAILTANELSATKNVTKSADGKMVCKRQAVVGSNFKRKICMTQTQWEQMATESRSTTEGIQRRKGPGVNN